MSRVIVKNINAKVSVCYLYKLFSPYGTVTDVKIFKDQRGKVKNFCFIGFDKINSAKRAIETLNGMFINNNKITVQEAQPKIRVNTSYLGKKNTKKQVEKNSFFLKNFESKICNENAIQKGSLCIKNIHTKCKISELETIFQNFGFLDSITMSTSQNHRALSKTAYIKFGLPEYAIYAAACLDGKIFQGKILHIVDCKNLFYSTYKDDSYFGFYRDIKKKFIFENFDNHKSWFLFFIPEDLVFKNLISKYGRESHPTGYYRQLKINQGQNMMTEGRIQNEVFVILRREGLNLDAFNPTAMMYKSKKIILIKNLFIGKKRTLDILALKLKQLLRYVILPLTGITLIEFVTKQDAALAYDKLEKFYNDNNRHFFIQWAPSNCFIKNSEIVKHRNFLKKKPKEIIGYYQPNKVTYNNYLGRFSNESKKRLTTFKLLIRNIPFSTSMKTLKKMFANFDHLLSIRIPKKKKRHNSRFLFYRISHFGSNEKSSYVNTKCSSRKETFIVFYYLVPDGKNIINCW